MTFFVATPANSERFELVSDFTPSGDQPTAIESLVVENPRFDLGAPLPALPGERIESSEEPSFAALVIRELEVAGGTVIGPVAPDSMDAWFDTWRAEEIGVRGEVLSTRLRIETASARWIVESHRRDPIDVQVLGDREGVRSSLLMGVVKRTALHHAGSGCTLY